MSCGQPHLCIRLFSLDPYQVNKESRKNGQQVNNINKEPHTREPRHPWDSPGGFVDSHQFEGSILRLALMEMDSLDIDGLLVYKEDKMRL